MKKIEELLKKTEGIEDPVAVIYCKCGKSLVCASNPDLLKVGKENSQRRKGFNEAMEWSRKVEILPVVQVRGMPFYCNGVNDCPDKM